MNKHTSKALFREICSIIKEQGFVSLMYIIMMATILYPFHVYLKDLFCIFALPLCLKNGIDKTAKWLLCFSLFYVAILTYTEGIESTFEYISYLFGPISFYLFGRNVVRKSKNTDEINTFLLLTIVVSTWTLYQENISDFAASGLVNVRRSIEFLSVGPTFQGMIASLGIFGIAYILAYTKPLNLKLILFTLVFLGALYVDIHLILRTGIVVTSLVIMIVFIYLYRRNRHILFPIIFLLLVVLFVMYIQSNYMEIVEAYESRENLESYNSATLGGRVRIWEQSLNLILNYPLGWSSSENVGYSHNLWIDIARRTGWLPLLISFVFTLKNLKITWKLFKIPNNRFIAFLIGINTCVIASAFVEPVIEACSSYFYLICMLWGIQYQYYTRIRLERTFV